LFLTGRPPDWLTRLLVACTILTALFSIATAANGLHRYLELFSHFRLQYFAASVLLCIGLLVLKRRGLAAVMATVAVINATFILPWYTGMPESPGKPVLTLLHTNILAGNRNAGPLLAHIERERPDVVFIQELTDDHVQLLDSLTKTYPYQLSEPHSDPFGIGVWSKLPFRSATVVESPPLGLPSLDVIVEFDGSPLRLLSTHPVPPVGRGTSAERNRQLEFIAALARQQDRSTVVIGDLNITPWAAHYKAFENQSRLRNAQRGHGIKPTWPLFLPLAMIPIDHALTSADLVATDVRTLRPVGSDHLPLLVDIARR
jgi:endonuclease/exonuclease/phosphatase (EEP) superfamily protein YafD